MVQDEFNLKLLLNYQITEAASPELAHITTQSPEVIFSLAKTQGRPSSNVQTALVSQSANQ